ncbi:MAG: hypothetical protein WC683_09860 [bacterium]
MDDFSVTMDATQLEARLNKVAQGLRALPLDKNTNPLSVWIQSYQLRERAAQRPTVNAFGAFRGAVWHPLEPAYTRVTDGRSVPVWGGVPRLRAGRVTRARTDINAMGQVVYTSKRKGRKLGSFASVVPGQTFTTGPVKGKLKSDGSRYKPSDKQLGRDSGGHVFGEWISPRNIIIAAHGLVAVLTHPFAWAAKVNESRRFAWSSGIEEQETREFRDRMLAYFNLITGNA